MPTTIDKLWPADGSGLHVQLIMDDAGKLSMGSCGMRDGYAEEDLVAATSFLNSALGATAAKPHVAGFQAHWDSLKAQGNKHQRELAAKQAEIQALAEKLASAEAALKESEGKREALIQAQIDEAKKNLT